jgi:hypothetical protein
MRSYTRGRTPLAVQNVMTKPNEKHEHGFGGDYARDTHRGGLGDDYARDGGWSGAGRADDRVRDVHRKVDEVPVDETEEPTIGKASE